jgi:hypothetical protein
MAEYLGTTASSGAIIKKHKKEALEEYLSKWGFSGEGDVQAEIREGDKSLRGRHTLHIYGDDDFYPVKLDEDGEFPDEMESDCRGFIKGLAPFLETSRTTKPWCMTSSSWCRLAGPRSAAIPWGPQSGFCFPTGGSRSTALTAGKGATCEKHPEGKTAGETPEGLG